MSRKVKAEEYMTWDKCIRDDTKTSDCVSREAVMYYIQSHINEIITESGIDKNAHTNSILRALLNGVKTMPSVQPERAKGEWENANDDWLVCGECGFAYNSEEYSVFPYCPCCGTEMR